MAATAKKIVGVSEDPSSSDDEVLRRCQEAVWETRSDTKKDGGNVQQSKRIVVADHDHDGNELQVTQGFRTHVAKKLGNLLDSRFTEMKTETESCAEISSVFYISPGTGSCRSPSPCEAAAYLQLKVDSAGAPVNDEHGNSEQEHTQVKVKRKKNKKRHTEEEV
ncbi:hypothetical protein JOQ06_012319 [Pogonophryne albipinna]|uniref:Protein CUSTOS n=1 Tax=Pogonophryne albipinna TaxID=1090488 RepID=A0AAD6BGD2_9TELE|nr:hypothetical protein JOQ06_012319 [Pogonophryne albipinna]